MADLKSLLADILVQLKYQTKLLETMVSNQPSGNATNTGKVMAEALRPLMESNLLPDGHPAKKLLKESLDKLVKGQQ